MVKPENFSISFKDDQKVFYAGQILEGFVKFRFQRPERAKALNLFFTGIESTYSGPTGTKRAVEDNEIFKVKRILWDNPCGYFEAKSYVFPFKVDLGAYNFPSSYEGENASIRYKFKAVIDRPSRFGHTTVAPITLLSSIPNFVPALIKPETFSAEAVYGVVSKEKIRLTADTKFRSCTPGGNIVMDISVYPRNTKSVNTLSIKLIQNIQLIDNETPSSQKEISAIEIPAHRNDDDDNDLVRLSVPSTTPPDINSSQILGINYYIVISAAVAWSYTPLILEIPVQIATLNVTLEEIPPLLISDHYLPPNIDAGEFYTTSDGKGNARHSLTPSLISDVSSIYSHESDEMDPRKQPIQPNYSPERYEKEKPPFSAMYPLDISRSVSP
ncbi:hypothetical protein K502DRAFT_337177 [Neoconidiobolus thromboides FSU 785]|nr:hypothetical protein K502DRAFT_337177 [Neoconidiobolus thromboides FSU 785]